MSLTIILSWIWVNIFKLGFLGLVVLNIKKIIQIFILQPLQGDDERTSMNELAKFVILGLLIFTIHANKVRITEYQTYSDTTIGYLIGGVFSIAAINPIASIFRKKKEEEE